MSSRPQPSETPELPREIRAEGALADEGANDAAEEGAQSPLASLLPLLARDVHLVQTSRTAYLGACAGFVLSVLLAGPRKGAVVWVSQRHVSHEAGVLYGPGLHEYALDPGEVIHVRPPSLTDVFWAMEQALQARTVGAVVGEFHAARPLDLTLTRRLALRSRRTGVPVYLIEAGGTPFASAAQTHWRVLPHRGFAPPHGVSPPAWRLELSKNRQGPCRTFACAFDVEARQHVRAEPAPPRRMEAPAREGAGEVVATLDFARRVRGGRGPAAGA